MGKKYYIVWNQSRTEGYITDDPEDADYAATGFSSSFGQASLGFAFRESYAEDEDSDEFDVQEIEIPTN